MEVTPVVVNGKKTEKAIVKFGNTIPSLCDSVLECRYLRILIDFILGNEMLLPFTL
jgi:hypothetical protein